MAPEEFDVIVVGAGISGVCAAHYLRERCPGQSFAILEGRDAIGGTWDLFRYPGVRSDSDMFTLGFSFRPWTSDRSIALGPTIRDYVQETAHAEGVEERIRFGHRVTQAAWSTTDARWTVTAQTTAGEQRLRCRFLWFCSGYYDYAQGHEPDWPGRADFRGRIVHPQHWPEDLDFAGKRVVVIGSGATAVTIVPEMARRGAQVTMLQRSPSYILPVPARDGVGAALQRWLPAGLAYRLVRWKNILAAWALYQAARRWPEGVRRWLMDMARKQLPGVDVERHFAPPYAPWDQRLCFIPDADLFAALRSGRASVATDDIETFTPTGLRLRSGATLDADIVVAATGLQLQMLGGTRLMVDGEPVNLARRVAYRGFMFNGVPNLAMTMGYTNASWTLRAELVARHLCRLLLHMRKRGDDFCVPVYDEPEPATRLAIDLSSGYVQRAAAVLPRQGERAPWRVMQNYLQERIALRWSRLDDGALRFARAGELATLPGNAEPVPAAE
ncbi:NAD(P)/FAD-dependent oxidoreductase [Ramlibacter sp. G-1-2-2]|uniref:NAD(P)/FAD-dependent oxidoreductase n=1 Tax=Ramlibacter agri TaxID=2728837 RepID=A0A848GUX7_9BURK|nr:NAD(P)/FAD-dependent oxidoreductase [Ramlibacter agri]NML42164.1 NAD(P)/FAD-dependent oxidoreductase [Ramlibacter agri]